MNHKVVYARKLLSDQLELKIHGYRKCTVPYSATSSLNTDKLDSDFLANLATLEYQCSEDSISVILSEDDWILTTPDYQLVAILISKDDVTTNVFRPLNDTSAGLDYCDAGVYGGWEAELDFDKHFYNLHQI